MSMAKSCLVIDSRKAEKISLDGPALKVRMQSQSSRLFPLRRLSRIHILGDPSTGMDALIHCAENQIPVAFFTTKGKLRCQLYFPVFENNIIAHWLEHIEFDAAASHEYEEWLSHQRLHLLSQIRSRTGPIETRLQLTQEKLNSICKRKLAEKDYRLALDWLDGMLTVHLSQIIVNQGLANQSRNKRRLMDDLTPVLDLWLKNRFSQYLEQHTPPITARRMSEFYQDNAEWMEYLVRKMLTQLASRLEAII